jgi:hypothetical protein
MGPRLPHPIGFSRAASHFGNPLFGYGDLFPIPILAWQKVNADYFGKGGN